MSEDLSQLYQPVIFEHGNHPRNANACPGANRRCGLQSPVCGDHILVCLRVEGDRIADAGFESLGCALCRASASFMTCSLKGRTVQEARRLNAAFQRMVGGGDVGPECEGDLIAFAVVRSYPARRECVLLPWHAAMKALESGGVGPAQ